MTATPKQRGYIHALAAKAGMDDDTRRLFLKGETGHESTLAMSIDDAKRVIDRLIAMTGGGRGKGAVAGLDTPVARKLRALWIAAYDLGLLADRSDRAMLAFLERQCRVSHTRFLSEPGQASAAIEGLKSWLARDGKVEWPAKNAPPEDHKRAVCIAQWARLVEIGAVKPFVASMPLSDLDSYYYVVVRKNDWSYFNAADYAKLQNALGRKLRLALAKKKKAA